MASISEIFICEGRSLPSGLCVSFVAACGDLHSPTMKSLKIGLKYSQSTYHTVLGLLLAAQFGQLVHFVSSCLMTTLALLHKAVLTSKRDLVKLHIIEVVSSNALTDPEPLTLYR